MRFLLPAFALLASALWAPAARAECPQPYTPLQFTTDLVAMRTALSGLETQVFAETGKRLEAGIVCLSGAAGPTVFAEAYRYIGAYKFLIVKDEADARRWFRSAQELVPTMVFGADELELGHPLRAAYEEENERAGDAPVVIPGKVVFKPAGSKLLIDGRPLTTPGATLDRPHIVQQIGSDGAARGTYLIEGNAVPALLLQDKPVEVAAEPPPETKKPAKKKAKEESGGAVSTDGTLPMQKLKRVRPPEQIPAIIGGALCVIGAGGVFAASFAAHDQFERVHTTEDLESARALTNALVITSGGVLVLGAGVGYWAFTLDGGAGVGFAGSF